MKDPANEKERKMRRNDKNLEIDMASTVVGTKVHFVLLKGGAMYYRMKDICKVYGERYPGEHRDSVSVISARDYYTAKKETLFRYVRIWYEGCSYIHETDVKNYILERQGRIENNLLLCAKHRYGGWTEEAAAVIKRLFNVKVTCNARHETVTAPKEIADKYAGNPKLRAAYIAYNNIIKGLETQRRLAPYWAEAVKLDERLGDWKAIQEDEQMQAWKEYHKGSCR